jgi:hypothetical protein
MGKLKAFLKWGGLAGGGAFALYVIVGGLVGLTCGWPFAEFALPGAIGCGIGTGLATGAVFAWDA